MIEEYIDKVQRKGLDYAYYIFRNVKKLEIERHGKDAVDKTQKYFDDCFYAEAMRDIIIERLGESERTNYENEQKIF